MALVGWYFLAGLASLGGVSFYLQSLPLEAKLKEQLSLSFGGMVILLFWPIILVTAIVSMRRKKSPDE